VGDVCSERTRFVFDRLRRTTGPNGRASFETPPDIRFLVAIGVFGGFTTFSAFSLQTMELLRDGKIVRAMLYTVASVVLCLGATSLGIYAAGST
jgi:protein CrcB